MRENGTGYGHKQKESREALEITIAQWLGAIFEIEGSLYFSKEKKLSGKHKKMYAWPVVRIGNVDLTALEEIKKNLGVENLSVATSHSDNSKTISITRRKALEIAEQIEAYAPSRALAIEHFRWWGEATTTEEKYQAAVSYEERKDVAVPEVSQEAYLELLKYPAFVAGLIDLRGNMFDISYEEFSKQNNKYYLRHRKWMALYSSKIHLLAALRRKFLGVQPFETNGTWGWRVESQDLENLMEFVGGYLRIHKSSSQERSEINVTQID